MIKVNNLSVYYKYNKDYLVALDNISLDVKDGEFLVVIGPSGGGKTSLLKALLDQLDYISGEILIDGIPLLEIPLKERQFAYISQSYSLYSKMTVYENIAFPLRMMKTSPTEIDQRVLEIAKKLNIEVLLTRKPKALSGRQQQLVAIARALIKNPRLILFDEPFSNLDPSIRAKLRRIVKKIHQEERPTFIYATHDQTEAMSLADRIVIISDGEIEYIGDPMELKKYAKSDFAKEFIKK